MLLSKDMADPRLSVRSARFNLAQCLVAEGGSDEALEQLQRVLNDPGTDPRDSTVYISLGELHEARNDLVNALEALVQAVSRDGENSGGVSRARALIERHPGAAINLPDDSIQMLEASLRSRPDVASAWWLAGELWVQRGEYRKALDAFSEASGDESDSTQMKVAEVNLALGNAEEARQSLLKATIRKGRSTFDETQFRLLLARAEAESGHYPEALATLPEGGTPEHCFVRALASVGQGRSEEALLECETQTSLDTLLLRTVIHLHAGDVDNARSDALAAAAQHPTSPDCLLIRAQVELESAGNLEEGRGLLEQMFAAIRQDLPKSRWPVLQQPFAGGRPTYQYFLAEAADVSKARETLDLVDAVTRTTTTLSQDGRLDYIRGSWLRDQGKTQEASEAFEGAASNFDSDGLIPSAVSSARQAFELGRSASSAAQLGELLWRMSFREMPDVERLRYVDEAGQILATQDFAREEIEDTDSLVYYAGLVDLRKAELIERDQQPRAWEAVAELMAVVLNSDHEPYRTRFLADALAAVGAFGPAMIFADRAFAWKADDEMRETAAVARANYCRGTSPIETLLEGFVDLERFGNWRETIRFAVQVDSGEHAKLAGVRPRVLFDAPWARFIEAKAIALLDGEKKARPLFEKVAEELNKRGSEHSAAQAWLHAGQPLKAIRILDEGVERQNVPLGPTAWLRALAAVASGKLDQVSAVLQCLERLAPIDVSEALYATLPIFREVYGESVVRGLDSVAERLQDMVLHSDNEPSWQDGLDEAPEPMRPLLFAMADLIERAESGRDVKDGVERLKVLKPGGRLERVIEHACDRLLVGEQGRKHEKQSS